jgi:nucleoside 2-deoxyribosyltransferase
MPRIKTYLAAPLFNDRELAFNSALANLLVPYCEVFLPQRDGLLLADLLADGVSREIAETRIFESDRWALERCEMLIAVLDGAHIELPLHAVASVSGSSRTCGAHCRAAITR